MLMVRIENLLITQNEEIFEETKEKESAPPSVITKEFTCEYYSEQAISRQDVNVSDCIKQIDSTCEVSSSF